VKSLTHLPISITHEGDEFVITQNVGATADDVVSIRIGENQAAQIAKFLTQKDKPDESEPLCLADGFVEFWLEYPRKDGKARAFDLWKRQRLHLQAEKVMAHLRAVKATDQWSKDGGRFVPHAATYLSQKRYLDEVESEDASAWQ
jgi:hypothetical protein